ncbi:conserved exported hypothetical protein [Desulfamplus magnetovallimortis]|uniref:Secreted protein n=1 Tax=Desulfamplus magnetovallimortis TaxID=1246637 RepID=A0A1W1HIP5_9BACT|nr:hypothetical protein [Desulfamplus magnetovallimortis]SLM32303.1 conserved exported hypothetical protein [Desulfamplus magnetovallimortis]
MGKNHYWAITILALMFALSPHVLAGDGVKGKVIAPKHLGGFTLGESIDSFKERIKSDSRMCIRYHDYLQEVEVYMCPVFKSGLISIANCQEMDKIVRIKLKFQDDSRKFYDTVLKYYKNKFGEPDEWKGDAFGVVLAWKWSFVNDKGENISLIFQHNNQDEDLKMGNVVKLANTTLIENEEKCYNKSKDSNKKKMQKQIKRMENMNLDSPELQEYIIPR